MATLPPIGSHLHHTLRQDPASIRLNEQERKIYTFALETLGSSNQPDFNFSTLEHIITQMPQYATVIEQTSPDTLASHKKVFFSLLLHKLRASTHFLLSSPRVGTPRPQQPIPSWGLQDMLRHVAPHDPIFAMTNPENRLKETENLSSLIKQGDWDGLVAAYASDIDALAYDALTALRCQKISMQQFCTLLIRWSLAKDFPDTPIITHRLFDDDGIVIQETMDSIDQTLLFTGNHESSGLFLSTPESRNAFYSWMQEQPPSEAVFWSVPYIPPSKPILPWLNERNRDIASAIYNVGGVNCLHRFKLGTEERIMVPTFTMMQIFLNANAIAHKSQPITLTPMVAAALRDDFFADAVKKTRLMSLPLPKIPLPGEADFMPVLYMIYFIFHDLYHALLVSYIPQNVKELSVTLIRNLTPFLYMSSYDPILVKYIHTLFECLLDLEYPPYRYLHEKSEKASGTLLVQTIEKVLEAAMHRMYIEQLPKDPQCYPSEDQKLEWLLNLKAKMVDIGLVETIAEILIACGLFTDFEIIEADLESSLSSSMEHFVKAIAEIKEKKINDPTNTKLDTDLECIYLEKKLQKATSLSFHLLSIIKNKKVQQEKEPNP